MRVDLEQVYILHSRAFRNTSLLLEMLTAQHGRIGLVAKGVRGQRSRHRGVLQAFRPLLVSWSGKGELGTLTQVEEAYAGPLLTGRALRAGFYLNELLVRLVHRHEPLPELFASYDRAIRELGAAHAEEPVLRIFEKQLLEVLGYGLLLGCEAETERPVEDNAIYQFQIEYGPVRCAGEADPSQLKVHGSTLLALGRESLHGQRELREAKALMRAALSWYLGDEPLHSRALFRGPRGQGAF